MAEAVESFEGKADVTEEYMQEVFDIMKEYEEESVFWETGALFLAQRDCCETYSEEEWEAMDNEEARKIFYDMEMKYFHEWEEHGCDRLRIVEEQREGV
jgi:hypothetical protein